MRGLATIPTRTDNSLRSEGYRQGGFVRHGGMRTDRRSRPFPRRLEARWMKGVVRGVGEDTSGEGRADLRVLHEDELLTPSTAAAIASRSVRTIRRAYLGGTLVAYRDGGGRGVRIRYGDLLDWMMRKPVTPVRRRRSEPGPPSSRSARPPAGKRKPSEGPSENLALLNAARRRRSGRAGAAVGRAEQTPASRRA